MIGNYFCNRLTLESDFEIRFVVDGNSDNEIITAKFSYSRDDFTRKARAVFQGAAPTVFAPVRPGCPELIDDAMIRCPDFDSVKAGVPASSRSLYKALDGFLNFSIVHRVTAVGIMVTWQSGRRPVGVVGVVRITVLSYVVKLLKDQGSFFLDSFSNLPEVRNDFIAAVPEISTRQYCRRMYRHWFNDEHRRSSHCPFAIVGKVPFSR